MDKDTEVKLLKLASGPELTARTERREEYYILFKPVVVVQTGGQGGRPSLGVDDYPQFKDEDVEEIEMHERHVICVTEPHPQLRDAYLQSIGEKAIIEAPKQELIIPN